MNCPIIPSKENQLAIYTLVASGLLENSKNIEQFNVNDYIKELYDYLSSINDGNEAAVYTSLIPKFIRKAYGLNDEVADLLVSQLKTTRDLEKSFDSDFENVINYITKPTIDSKSLTEIVNNQPPSGPSEPPIDLNDSEDFEVDDFFEAIPLDFFTTTGRQTEFDTKTNKFTNVPIKSKERIYSVLQKVITKLNEAIDIDKIADSSELTYFNHKGIKLRLINETELPNNAIPLGREPLKTNLVYVLTDNDGNYLGFNEKGQVDKDGQVLYYSFRTPSKENIAKINTLIDEIMTRRAMRSDSTPESLKAERKYLENKRDVEIALASDIQKDYNTGKIVLANIIDGSKGYVEPGFTKSSQIKNIELSSETISYIKAGKNLLKVDGISKKIDIKGTILSYELEKNLSRVLASKKLTNTEKINYLNSLVFTGKKVKIIEKGNDLYFEVPGSKKTFNLNDTTSDELLEAISNDSKNRLYFAISMEKLKSPRYLDIQVKDDGSITKVEKNYYDLLKENTIVNAKPNSENNIVEVNGYFNLSYTPIKEIKEEKEIIKKSQDINESYDENPNPYNLEISKFIERLTSSAQQTRADKWWKSSEISKVKIDGKVAVPLEVLRNIVNSNAFANWSVAGIKLFNGSDNTHIYHEAWHAFSQLFLTKEEKNSLYDAVSKLPGTFKSVTRSVDSNGKLITMLEDVEFSKASKRQLEEYIAEEFRNFAIAKGDTKGLKGVIKSIFKKIWSWLKAMYHGVSIQDTLNNPTEIKPLNDMFKALYVGNINNYTPSVENVMFSSANYGIISLGDINEERPNADSELIRKSIDGILSEALLASGPKFIIRGLSNNKNKIALYEKAVIPKLEKKYEDLLSKSKDISLNADEKEVLDSQIDLLKWTLANIEPNIEEAVNGFSEQNEQAPGVIAFHMANSEFKDLLKLNIEEEDVDKLDEKELEKSSRMNGKAGNEESSISMANKQVLYLVKSLLKQESANKFELNELGFPELVDFSVTWNNLTRKLTGIRGMTTLYNTIKQYADEGNLLFGQLLKRLGTPISDTTGKEKSLEEKALWFKFLQDFNKPIQQLWTVNFETKKTNDGIEFIHKTGRASSDLYKVIADWKTQFKTADSQSNDFILETPNGENYLNLPKIVTTFLNKNYILVDNKVEETFTVKPGKEIAFLNAIGINITVSEQTKKDLEKHNTDINFLANKISELNNVNAEIINPIETYNSKGIITKKKVYNTKLVSNVTNVKPELYITKGIDLTANINRLAEIQSTNSDDYSSLSRLTAGGKKSFEQSLNSSESQVIYALQNVKNKNEFSNEQGEFAYMSYLDEANNPSSKASWMLKSLFDLNNKKIASNDIDLVNESGASLLDRTGNMIEEEGVAHSDMGTLDKFLTDFTSLLTQGIVTHQQAGSKSTHLATKINKISTYDGKKQNHLFADTKEFITDNEGNYKGSDKVYDIVVPYIQMELERIIKYNQNKDVYDLYKGFSEKTTGDFSLFDDIFSDEVKNELKKISTDELKKGIFPLTQKINLADILNSEKGETLKNKVKEQLKYYFDGLYDDYNEKLMSNYGTVTSQIRQEIFNTLYPNPTEAELSKLKDPIFRAQLDVAALKSFVHNDWLYKVETNILHYRDTTIFNHAKDEFHKRTSLFQSTGKVFPTDITSINLVNSIGTPYTKSITGKSRVYDGTLNTGIIQDYTHVRQNYYDILDKLFTKDFISKGLTGDTLTKALYGQNPETKELGNKKEPQKGGKMTPYNDLTVTDGQGYITLDGYRTLKFLEGKWSPKQEELYKKIVNKESPGINEITEIFPVYKLQMAGNLKTARGLLPVTSGHKFALMPLIPDMIEGSPLEDLHKAMMNQEIDYITHDSGSKLASIASSIKNGKPVSDEAFDNEGKYTGVTFTKNVIYANYLKNQVDLHDEYTGNTILSSQLRKLISTGLIIEKVPIDFMKGSSDLERKQKWFALSENKKLKESPFYNLIKNVDDRIDKLIELNKDKLLSKIKGWSKDPKTKRYSGPESSMISFIEKEFKKQGLAPHEIDYIKKDKYGNLERDLSGSPSSGQMERMLMAIINNKIVKQLLNGEALVEVTVANTFKFKNVTKEMIKYGYTDLNYYEPSLDETPTKASQCKISMQGSYENLFNLKDLENNLIKQFDIVIEKNDKGEDVSKKVFNPKKSLDNLNSLLRNEEWLDKDNNRKKIRLTGVRIPVQGLNSMEFLEIAEFLPADTGPIIILPAEIVAKSGTDFDVDKLTTYMAYISKSGKYIDDSYKNEQELDEKIIAIRKKLTDLIDKEIGPKQTVEKLIEKFNKEQGDKSLFRKALKIKRDQIRDEQSELIDDIQSYIKDNNQDNKIIGSLEKLMTTTNNQLAVEILKRFKKIPVALSSNEMIIAVNSVIQLESELSSIKNTLKDSYDTEEESIEYNNIRELNSEYKDLKDHKRNYIKGVQNSLITDIINILQLSENAVRLLTANDTHLTKPYADEMEDFVQEQNFRKSRGMNGKTVKKGISPTRIFEYDFNLKKHQDNFVGKNSLGIAATSNPANILYNNAGAYIPVNSTYTYTDIVLNKDGSYTEVEKTKDIPNEIYLNTRKSNFILKNGSVINAISLSHIYDKLNENEISEIINQLMNGFVDVEKDAWVAFIQGNKEVTPVILFLLETGVPFKDIVYYVNNPLIRKYISEIKSNKGVLGPVLGKSSLTAKANAKREIWNKILNKTGTMPNIEDIQKDLHNTMGDKIWSTTELQDIAKTDINLIKYNDNAINGLKHYIYLEELVRNFNEPRNATNFDTKKSSDLFDVYKRQQTINELYKSTKMPHDILDYYLNEGPIRGFKTTEIAEDMFGSFFKFKNDIILNDFIHEKLKDYAVRSKIKSITGFTPETFPARFKNSVLLQLSINNLKSFSIGESVVYKGMKVKYINTGTKAIELKDDELHINENILKKEFKNLKFTKEYKGPGSYSEQKLSPLNKEIFFRSGNYKNALIGAQDYYEFVIEREYLRSIKPLEEVSQTIDFKNKYNSFIKTFKKKANETPEEFEVRADKIVTKTIYEKILKELALENTFNINSMFYNNQQSGTTSYAKKLSSLIKKYPILKQKYSILKQLSTRTYSPTDFEPLYQKDLLNIALKDYNDLTPESTKQYHDDLVKLANPNIKKLLGDSQEEIEDNARLSDLFRKFPMYVFLQGGINKNEFAFTSILPYDDSSSSYTTILNDAISKMKNNLSNTLLENALNLFLENNNVRTKKLNQRTSSFNLRTGIVSKEFLKGEEKYTIIPKGSEFVERLTSTSSDEIYTVNLNNLKDNDVTLLANRYKQKAYFISADTAIRRNLLNTEGIEASNSYVNKMPVSSKFLLSDNFGLGLRLSKDIGVNYKLTFDNLPLIKNMIDEDIQEMAYGMAQGVSLIFDENGYGQNLLEYPEDATPETIDLHNELYKYLTDQLKEKLDYVNPQVPIAVTIESPTQPSISIETNESINFAYRPFISKLGRFDTVEGAFQAAKAEFVPLYSSDYKDNLNEVKKLNHAKGENAKLIGENLKGVDIEAWNKVSSTILKELLKQSFEQNQEVTPKTKPVSGAINYPKIFKFFNTLGIKNFDKILEKKHPNISLVTIYPSTKDLNDIDSYDYVDGINFKHMMNAITTMQKLNASKDFALFYDFELDKHYSLYDFVKLIAKDVYDINPKILNPNMKDLFDETFTNLAENKDAENAFDKDKNCNG